MNRDITATGRAPRQALQRVSRGWWRSLTSSQEVGVFLLLMLMCLYLYFKTNTFTSPASMSNIMKNISWIAIAALGQTLVIIAGGIDLSSGAVMALSGLAAAYWISGDKSPWAVQQVSESGRQILLVGDEYVPIGLLIGCLMGLLIGVVNGILVAWGGLPPFIATLGTMSVARGICYGWLKGQTLRGLPHLFTKIGQGELLLPGSDYTIPYPTIVMVVLVIIMSIFLLRTIWGYRVYAIGGNEQAAQLSGINTRHVKLLAFSLSGLMAGIGGTLMTARLGAAAPTAAQGYELDVIAAVFIGGASVKGGKGTMIGALIGAATMGVLRTGLNLVGFESYWQPSAIGLVIIIAIMLDRARQNPQVHTYFSQLEGRIAVACVLFMAILSAIGALILGYGADAMIAFLLALVVLSILYALFYKGLINPIEEPWKRWAAVALFVVSLAVVGAVIVGAIWFGVRYAMIYLLQTRKKPDEVTLEAVSA